MRRLKGIALPLVLGAMIAGCSPEARDQYSGAGQDVGNAAQKTGQAVATDAEKTKAVADNTIEASKIKSALTSASGLETKDINVECDIKAGTITLNGSVPDEKQKTQAETVAKGIGGSEFKVSNNLKVVSN